jgi:Sigma-70, region 4/Bacterial RNA polymerase, alpha chain C terminal domain
MQANPRRTDDPADGPASHHSAGFPPGFPQADRLAKRGLTVHVSELDISAATLGCLAAADIIDVPQLVQQPADDLLTVPRFGALELYEIVCQLNAHGLSLPPVQGGRARGNVTLRNREILRLRLIDGLTFVQIANQVGLQRERVRQILLSHYGLTGQPPAVKARQWREGVQRVRSQVYRS